jgi:tetratricopeptide (TPR) repeat protein
MHSHLKNNDAALKDIDQAIALAPHNSFHYQFRGILNFGLERNAVALENFNKAIELLPNWAGHYVWRAAIFYELRDFESTLRDLDTAVNLKPDEVSLFWRGLFYLDRGEILKALYDLYSAYKEANRPIHSRIVFWLGVAQLLASHIDEALHYFDECARLSAADERKVARYTEPARLALLTPILNWVKKQTPSSSSITPCTTLSLSTTSPSNSNSSSTAPTTTSHPPPPHSTLTNNNNNENSHPTTKRQSQVKKSEIISFPYNVCCRQEDIDSGVACAKGFYEAFFKVSSHSNRFYTLSVHTTLSLFRKL